ncbi:MAG TPA: TetR family transcriptional regulator [Pseudonocardiaceae bacterium]|jgi:AcrR family transcriptional regulator|nr:TetR family transcriptional regulator [Pseudonocardiaceae bacterium]
MTETPRERRVRQRSERRQVLTEPADMRLERARELMEQQRIERREARGTRSGRAPAMSVEERRAAVLQVAVPMLIEHGAHVKTSEIAAAAGIAEGTLFRAFKDKQALFVACLHEVLESRGELEKIEAIDRSLPLGERLTQAVRAVSEYQSRLWAVMVALRSAGVDPRDGEPGQDKADRFNGPPQAMIGIANAMASLFEPETLRVSPDLAARLLLGSVFSNRLQSEGMGDTGADLPELVDLFLHGILTTEGGDT